MHCQTNSIIDQMEEFKQNYYSLQGKNMLFKKTQKMDCAKLLSDAIDLSAAIDKTVFRVPNTNKIVFNYNVFKLYANPNNYEQITDAVIRVYDEILKDNAKFEAHVILESFSMSAAERYKDGIRLFCNKCMGVSTKYANLLSNMYIYHTPAMFESISSLLRPFVDPTVTNRIILYSKTDSPALLQALFATK